MPNIAIGLAELFSSAWTLALAFSRFVISPLDYTSFLAGFYLVQTGMVRAITIRGIRTNMANEIMSPINIIGEKLVKPFR